MSAFSVDTGDETPTLIDGVIQSSTNNDVIRNTLLT